MRDFSVTEHMLPKEMRPANLDKKKHKKQKRRRSSPDPRREPQKSPPLVRSSTQQQQEPSEKSPMCSDLPSAEATSPLIPSEIDVAGFSHSSAESNQLSEVSDQLKQ